MPDVTDDEAPEHDLDHPAFLWGNGDGGCGHPACEDGTYVSTGTLTSMLDKRLAEFAIGYDPGPDTGCTCRTVTTDDGYTVKMDRTGCPEHDPPPGALVEAMRRSVHEALAAHYEPTGLVLHPLDHASVNLRPDDPDTVEHAKRVADAFDVPYWLVGIPGYRPPVRVRVRTWVLRLPRRVLTTVPGVVYRGHRRETGEGWMNDATPEPRAWKWGTFVGRYRIGTTPPEPEEEPW